MRGEVGNREEWYPRDKRRPKKSQYAATVDLLDLDVMRARRFSLYFRGDKKTRNGNDLFNSTGILKSLVYFHRKVN